MTGFKGQKAADGSAQRWLKFTPGVTDSQPDGWLNGRQLVERLIGLLARILGGWSVGWVG